MKHLNDVNLFVFKDWFESFDEVLIDYDDFPATKECIQCWNLMEKYDKKVRFISCDSSQSFQEWKNKLESYNVNVKLENLINPVRVMIDHLKSTKFNSKLFVVGTTAFKNEFAENGFKLADGGPNKIKEEIKYLAAETKVDEDVGAAIYDLDYNINLQRFNKLWIYMSNPSVSLLTGVSQETLVKDNEEIIGPKIFLNKLITLKGRNFEDFQKNSMNFFNYLLKTSNSGSPSKMLIISKSFSALKSPFKVLLVGDKKCSDGKLVCGLNKFVTDHLNDFCTRVEGAKL